MGPNAPRHRLGPPIRLCSRVASVFVPVVVLASCGEPSSPAGPPTSPSVPSQPPAITLAKLEVDPSVTGGQTARGTATLSGAAPQEGLEITLAADNTAVMVPSRVTIPAGDTSGTFEIATRRVTATTDVTITAQAGDVRRMASLRVRIDPASVRPTASYTIGFSGLRESRATFTTYEEFGFTIASVSGDWITSTNLWPGRRREARSHLARDRAGCASANAAGPRGSTPGRQGRSERAGHGTVDRRGAGRRHARESQKQQRCRNGAKRGEDSGRQHQCNLHCHHQHSEPGHAV